MCELSKQLRLELLVALAGSLSRAMAEELVLGAGAVYFSVTFPPEFSLRAFHGQVVTSCTEDETDRKGRSLTAQGLKADPQQSNKWVSSLAPKCRSYHLKSSFPEGFLSHCSTGSGLMPKPK